MSNSAGGQPAGGESTVQPLAGHVESRSAGRPGAVADLLPRPLSAGQLAAAGPPVRGRLVCRGRRHAAARLVRPAGATAGGDLVLPRQRRQRRLLGRRAADAPRPPAGQRADVRLSRLRPQRGPAERGRRAGRCPRRQALAGPADRHRRKPGRLDGPVAGRRRGRRSGGCRRGPRTGAGKHLHFAPRRGQDDVSAAAGAP